MTNATEVELGVTPAGVRWVCRDEARLGAMRERFERVCAQQRAKALLGAEMTWWFYNKARKGRVVAASREGREVLAKVYVSMYNNAYREVRWVVFDSADERFGRDDGRLPTPTALRSYAADKLPKKWRARLARREALSN